MIRWYLRPLELLGYLVYLGFIFLPGISIGEVFGIFRDSENQTERVALALGLGLAVDTLVLFLRTSGASLFGHSLLGIDLDTIYLTLALSAALLIAVAAVRRKLTFYAKAQRTDLAVFLVMVGLGAMLVAYLAKYPIFPAHESEDFASHILYSTGLVAGTTSSLPGGILYFGVEYQLAASILLVGGQALVTMRETMALLVFLSPLLFYLASARIFTNRVSALLVTVIYAFSAMLWFPAVFNTGLYPNFFGLLTSLFLVSACIGLVANLRSKRFWIFFGLVLFMAYMSHYSTLTVLPAMPLVAVLHYGLHRKDRAEARRYIIPAVVPLVPIVLIAAADPSLVQVVIRLAEAGGGNVTGSTTLSTLFSSVPVLQYLILEVNNDLAFVVIALLAAVYVYRSVAREERTPLPPSILVLGRARCEPGESQRLEVRHHDTPSTHSHVRAGNHLSPPEGGGVDSDKEAVTQENRFSRQIDGSDHRNRIRWVTRRRIVGHLHAH